MAISSQVQESIDDAVRSLREGLAFAARTESAMLVQAIGEHITSLEHLSQLDKLVEEFQQKMARKSK